MKKVIALIVALILLLSVGCTSGRDFDHRVGSIVASYGFSTSAWEFQTLIQGVTQALSGCNHPAVGTSVVTECVKLGDRIRTLSAEPNANNTEVQSELDGLEKEQETLMAEVDTIIAGQIEAVLEEQGIYNPWYKYFRVKIAFPSPNFKLETPPHELVISPRDRIAVIKTVLLKQDVTPLAMTEIEAKVDKLNVSSLVVDLGGLHTYPSIVSGDYGLQFILQTAAHEWTHQYLDLRPLGFRYQLNDAGLSYNTDIATMNETVADIVGKEIGNIVAQEYYPGIGNSNSDTTSEPAFDFDQEMRDIRSAVDQYLARGEIEAAEAFMSEKQAYLASQGYYIRKLNQAYFAFHGQYADTPAFTSPIGSELTTLRTESTSLGDFLNKVASMTSRQDLDIALQEAAQHSGG